MCIIVCSRQEGFSLSISFDSGWLGRFAVLTLFTEEQS
jgi:hypothetical protein